MTATISNLVQYYQECYRSDNREMIIYDFLDRKVEDKIYIEGREELLNNAYPKIPIDSKKASTILKKLELFQKEKELLYGSFFVCGHYIDFKGERKRLCAPLFYYPAEIQIKDEFHYLSIKASERRLNYPLINLLSKESDNNILHDPLFKELPSDFITFGNIGSIAKICKKYFPNVDFENIYAFPENANLKTIKGKIAESSKNKDDKSILLPTSILGIVAKSSNTRGVLNELSELSKATDHSQPLQSLLLNSAAPFTKKKHVRGELPIILSEAQQSILRSSSTNPLTLIVGPPGTGKTYTISAIAIEHMSRGESVLIASRTDEAVDVIVEKIENQIGIDKCVVRAGKKRSYSTPLKRFLKSLLTRVRTLKYLLAEFDISPNLTLSELSTKIKNLSASISSREKIIRDLEHSFSKEVDNEIKWGKHLSKSTNTVWDRLKTKYLDIRNKIQTPICEYNNMLHENDKELISDILQLIRLKYVYQIHHIVKNNWQDIKNFHEALKMSSDTEKLKKFKQINFDAVFKAFPIWLTNISEVKDSIPFEKEMFDVVIIDEATQCDIASCLPLIQRAKRVVFAGDPSQLRHISFLSRGIQTILRNKYELQSVEESKLNYRDKSILDLVMNALQSGDQVAMLDEHFRSLAPIIKFSNQQFYDNQLKIMTSRPDSDEQGLYFVNCYGKRDNKGGNEIEANKLLADIRELIVTEKELTTTLCSSIGIISPFRAQVELLEKLLYDNFSISEINRHNIRVGTAYSFQGEERDSMFLSFAVDSESHHSAINHINKEDVFNVAITRARNRQFIYHSVTKKDLKVDSLLYKYLSKPDNINNNISSSNSEHDKFLNEVTSALNRWTFNDHWVGFAIAGLKLDILVRSGDKYFGLDLVGYPGEFADTFGIERYRILNRAGINIFPLPYSDWYFEREKTENTLKDYILN